MNVHPWAKVLENANKKIKLGFTVHQQFNCSNCGAKQTMEKPNVFYKTGRCEQCGHVTDIERDGMNFMAMIDIPKET